MTASLVLLQGVWWIRRMHGIIVTTNYDHTYNGLAQCLVHGRCSNFFFPHSYFHSSFCSESVFLREAILLLGDNFTIKMGFPAGSAVNNLLANQYRKEGFDPWVGKIPWSRKWQPTPVFLPGKSHGQRSLADYSPGDHESQTWFSK